MRFDCKSIIFVGPRKMPEGGYGFTCSSNQYSAECERTAAIELQHDLLNSASRLRLLEGDSISGCVGRVPA
jgi:hypothetical protein